MSPAYYYNQGGGAPNPAQTMQMPPRGIPGQMGLPQAHFLQQQQQQQAQQAQQAPFRQPSMNDPNLHRKRAHSKVRLAINRRKQTRQDFLLFLFFFKKRPQDQVHHLQTKPMSLQEVLDLLLY
jgi:hypothetical protein